MTTRTYSTKIHQSTNARTLDALRVAARGRIVGLWSLEGCPPGAWPETDQAVQEVAGCLPIAQQRNYTLHEAIDLLYQVNPRTERFEARPEFREFSTSQVSK